MAARQMVPLGSERSNWCCYAIRRSPDHARIVANTRGELGRGGTVAAWAEGRAMTLERVIGYALGKDV